ncbi:MULTISPECIES: hypothetical protein [Nostocaceae]|nr:MULTISPECIES: hypothetical protein [Nostocaceae]
MSAKNKAILEVANAAIAQGNNEGFLSFIRNGCLPHLEVCLTQHC